MQTCSNCSDSFDDSKDGLVVTSRSKPVAAVCGLCCVDVRVGKIVVRRSDGGGFIYEQWLPAEMVGGAVD